MWMVVELSGTGRSQFQFNGTALGFKVFETRSRQCSPARFVDNKKAVGPVWEQIKAQQAGLSGAVPAARENRYRVRRHREQPRGRRGLARRGGHTANGAAEVRLSQEARRMAGLLATADTFVFSVTRKRKCRPHRVMARVGFLKGDPEPTPMIEGR